MSATLPSSHGSSVVKIKIDNDVTLVNFCFAEGKDVVTWKLFKKDNKDKDGNMLNLLCY